MLEHEFNPDPGNLYVICITVPPVSPSGMLGNRIEGCCIVPHGEAISSVTHFLVTH